MTAPAHLTPVPVDDLPVYPISPEDRLDSHYFVAWERRRWLNSDMRLKGEPEARALYLDLIWISYEQSPVGTLPDDFELLAKLVFTEPIRFRRLCDGAHGPLHRWQRCLISQTDEIRLFHPIVLRTIREAVSRKEDNRARNEAANRKKRLQRLRSAVAGLDVKLAQNDLAIQHMDEWLEKYGTGYRTTEQIERAARAFGNHMLERSMSAQKGGVS